MKIAVIGAGAWGTALAVSIGRSSLVSLYGANAELVGSMKQHRENQRYLPGVSLSEGVQVTNILDSALDGASGIVMAVPTKGVASVCQRMSVNRRRWNSLPNYLQRF